MTDLRSTVSATAEDISASSEDGAAVGADATAREMAAAPCLICGARLSSAMPGMVNQPYGGTVFSSSGQYGSTMFDPMDGHQLQVTVCDSCLQEAIRSGSVLLTQVQVTHTTYYETATLADDQTSDEAAGDVVGYDPVVGAGDLRTDH